MSDLRENIQRASAAKHGFPPDGQPTLEEAEERRGFGIPDNAMRVLQDFEAEVPKPDPEQPDPARAESPPEPAAQPEPEEAPQRPLRAERVKRFELPRVRQALAMAGKRARPGQTPCVLYAPRNGRRLLVLDPDHLAALIGEAEGGKDDD